MKITIPAMLLVCVLQNPTLALLEWSDDLIVRKAAASDTVAEARFVFRNASGRVITIRSVEPSCNCTAADLEKRDYAPGETGVIVARVDLSGKHGLVENTIAVEHDDGMLRIDRLRMNVEIAGLARITPTFLFWTMNGSGDTKVSIMEPAERGGHMEILSVEPSSRDFAWTIAQADDGRQELRIAPVRLDRRARTTFRVTVQVDTGTSVQTVYAHVK